MGVSQNISRVILTEVKSTTEMDKLLADASRLHLVETDRTPLVWLIQIISPENIAENVAMDTTPAQYEED